MTQITQTIFFHSCRTLQTLHLSRGKSKSIRILLPELKSLKIDDFSELTELKVGDSKHLEDVELANITHRTSGSQLELSIAKTQINVLKITDCILQNTTFSPLNSNIATQILFYQSIVPWSIIEICLGTGAAKAKNLVLQDSDIISDVPNYQDQYTAAKQSGKLVVLRTGESNA